jgi:hypothetical protein
VAAHCAVRVHVGHDVEGVQLAQAHLVRVRIRVRVRVRVRVREGVQLAQAHGKAVRRARGAAAALCWQAEQAREEALGVEGRLARVRGRLT